jgi:hypothetical protein
MVSLRDMRERQYGGLRVGHEGPASVVTQGRDFSSLSRMHSPTVERFETQSVRNCITEHASLQYDPCTLGT